MSEETKKPEPTKLLWYVSPNDQSQSIREHLSSLPDLVRQLDYGFEFQMPSVVCEKREEERKTEKYINWRGKERERTLPRDPNFMTYSFHLEFTRELNEEELKFWRAIKLGYLARQFHPEGSWRRQ